jgi:hypothetical protein
MRLTKLGSGTSLNFCITYFNRSSFWWFVRTWLLLAAGTAVFSSLNYLNRFLRVARDKTELLGWPITSITSCICSRSLVPGKRGNPVKSSIRMQPKEHDVRCTVEARLDVSVNDLMGETTRAKISHHDP